VLLTETIDTPVALLDPDQAPRQIVVDQMVAFPVQVHALGGHVPGEQQPHRMARQGELLDDLLLEGVRHPSVQEADGVPGLLRRESQSRRDDLA
jgi:hypothetical protein